jgi:hypothetical protein
MSKGPPPHLLSHPYGGRNPETALSHPPPEGGHALHDARAACNMAFAYATLYAMPVYPPPPG